MMVAVKRKHYLEAVLSGPQGRRQSVNYIPICKLFLLTKKTDDSYFIMFGKRKDKKGKSVATGAASVGCKGVLKQFGIDTEKSYSTRVTEYDKSDTALYVKVGAAK